MDINLKKVAVKTAVASFSLMFFQSQKLMYAL